MSFWGGSWGGGTDAVGALWVRINRDVPIIGHVGDIIELYHTRWISTAQQIEGAFDLDTAIGYSLDLWGELLGVKRLGLTDTDYRRLLLVQAVLVLSGSATRAKAIAVFERWTSAAAAEYRGTGRTIEIGGDVPAAYEARLLRLLRRAAPGARRVCVYSLDADSLVADYGLDPGLTTTTTDYGLDPVAGAALTAEPIQ